MRECSHTGRNKKQKESLYRNINSAETESTLPEDENKTGTDYPTEIDDSKKKSTKRPRNRKKNLKKYFKKNMAAILWGIAGTCILGIFSWFAVESKITVSNHEIEIKHLNKEIDNVNNNLSKKIDNIDDNVKKNTEFITEMRISIGKYDVIIDTQEKK